MTGEERNQSSSVYTEFYSHDNDRINTIQKPIEYFSQNKRKTPKGWLKSRNTK